MLRIKVGSLNSCRNRWIFSWLFCNHFSKVKRIYIHRMYIYFIHGWSYQILKSVICLYLGHSYLILCHFKSVTYAYLCHSWLTLSCWNQQNILLNSVFCCWDVSVGIWTKEIISATQQHNLLHNLSHYYWCSVLLHVTSLVECRLYLVILLPGFLVLLLPSFINVLPPPPASYLDILNHTNMSGSIHDLHFGGSFIPL